MSLFKKENLEFYSWQAEAVVRRCSVGKVFLKIFKIYKETHAPEPRFNNVAGGTHSFIKKETLALALSYGFRKIFKNTFSFRTPPVATSLKLS